MDQFEAQKTVLQQRIDVIENLQREPHRRAGITGDGGEHGGACGHIWLTSLNRTGNSIELQGESASINSVANFITQLKRSGYFDNVEIKSAAEDDIVPSVETYNFSMSASIATTPAAAPGAAAPEDTADRSGAGSPGSGPRREELTMATSFRGLALAACGSFLCGTRRCADPGGALRSGLPLTNIQTQLTNAQAEMKPLEADVQTSVFTSSAARNCNRKWTRCKSSWPLCRAIVPEEKQTDQFILMVQNAAVSSGVSMKTGRKPDHTEALLL